MLSTLVGSLPTAPLPSLHLPLPLLYLPSAVAKLRPPAMPRFSCLPIPLAIATQAEALPVSPPPRSQVCPAGCRVHVVSGGAVCPHCRPDFVHELPAGPVRSLQLRRQHQVRGLPVGSVEPAEPHVVSAEDRSLRQVGGPAKPRLRPGGHCHRCTRRRSHRCSRRCPGTGTGACTCTEEQLLEQNERCEFGCVRRQYQRRRRRRSRQRCGDAGTGADRALTDSDHPQRGERAGSGCGACSIR
jgi:hypothetical protein